jgi:hypothetical protein
VGRARRAVGEMASGKSVADGDIVVERVAISGATLSLIIQSFSSSEGDCDGLLFGHVQRRSTLDLVDDETGPQAPRDELTASVTGHCCTGRVMSFYDGAGGIDVSKVTKMVGERDERGGDAPIGWFVGRRESPLRPSMRESAVTANLRTMPAVVAAAVVEKELASSKPRLAEAMGSLDAAGNPNPSSCKSPAQTRTPQARNGGLAVSLASPRLAASGSSREGVGASISSTSDNSAASSQNVDMGRNRIVVPSSSPCLFLIFSESLSSSATHTHEYRAFQYRRKASGGGWFEPCTIEIVNIGPAFRGSYDSFAPVAPFPRFLKPSDIGGGVGMESSPRYSEEGLRRSYGKGETTDVINGKEKKGSQQQEAEQALLDMYSQDFSVDRLQKLISSGGKGGHVQELEDLYTKMLKKLEGLAKQVCESSDALVAKVLISSIVALHAMLFPHSYAQIVLFPNHICILCVCLSMSLA